MDSVRSINCFLSLIWWSCVEWTCRTSFVCLSRFLKQLKKTIYTQAIPNFLQKHHLPYQLSFQCCFLPSSFLGLHKSLTGHLNLSFWMFFRRIWKYLWSVTISTKSQVPQLYIMIIRYYNFFGRQTRVTTMLTYTEK